MTNIFNLSPFAASTFGVFDKSCQRVDVLIVSAAFVAIPGSEIAPADDQPPVRDADVYRGVPGLSSVLYEGEIATEKPLVDVLVNGHALAPRGDRARSVRIGLSVGDVKKELLVTGDRRWDLLGSRPGRARPFEKMPVVYERAFGGAGASCHPHNPIGVGYERAKSPDPEADTEVPNIEYPSQRVRSPRSHAKPAGFGATGRSWKPRVDFAGTYDERWEKDQCPMLPLDFDARHFQSAPPDQQSATIRGREHVAIRNMTPEGLWEFDLPMLSIPVRLRYSDRLASASLALDTILFEPDAYRFTLIARAKVPVVPRRGPLEEIIVGHYSRGWWRARTSGKQYIDRGTGGRLVRAEHFRL